MIYALVMSNRPMRRRVWPFRSDFFVSLERVDAAEKRGEGGKSMEKRSWCVFWRPNRGENGIIRLWYLDAVVSYVLIVCILEKDGVSVSVVSVKKWMVCSFVLFYILY